MQSALPANAVIFRLHTTLSSCDPIYPHKKVILKNWKLETDGRSVTLSHNGEVVLGFKDAKNIRTAIFIHLLYNANNICTYESIYKTSYGTDYPDQGRRAKVNQKIQRQINHLRLDLKGLPMEIVKPPVYYIVE